MNNNEISLNEFVGNFDKMQNAEDVITNVLSELPSECQFAVLADMIGIFCLNNSMPFRETYMNMADVAEALNTNGLYDQFKECDEYDY